MSFLEKLKDWQVRLEQQRHAILPMARNRWIPMGVFVVAVAASVPWLRPLPVSRFAVEAPLTALPLHKPARLERHDIPNPAPSAHSASLASLGPERIAAAWFAGSREGAGDVRILFSVFSGHDWTEPEAIITRRRVEQDTGRLVRKLGNPVLWHDGDGHLHLWFVSVAYGGWAGSALNHTVSLDGGRSWGKVRRLITSPFWNISTLVRNAPLPLADGGLALPVYHEFIAKRPEWLLLNSRGLATDKYRIPAAGRSLQPAVVAFSPHQALMLLRDASPTQRIRASRSEDGGSHWSVPQATALPNPNAGIALLHLADGRLLLAYNPQESNRNQLALSLSADQGQSWSPPYLIENGSSDEEFSYPTLLQDQEGWVHLAYTWKRKHIAHLSFHPEWLRQLRGIN
ncbi:exo-alpha-sialidase [Denitratisoma sp. agr-D3]